MKKLLRYISLEEFKKILKAEKDNKYKLAYVLAFGSGLRLSEIVGLRGKLSRCCKSEVEETYIELEGKKLKRYKCVSCGKFYMKSELRESGVWYIHPLTPEQIVLNLKQIKVYGKGGKERITCINPLFPIKENMLKLLPLDINRRTIQKRFERITEKTLGRNLNFHTLRHGFANHLINDRNLPLPMVQGFLGHTRLDTTGIYTTANPKQAIDSVWEGF